MLKRLAYDFFSLLFPEACNGCGTSLLYDEHIICTSCRYGLPFTDFHLYKENPVAKQLWGRLEVNAAMAMLYFKKAGKVQHIIHNLKYRNKTGVGLLLGNLMAEKLMESIHYKDIDLVIPVPLHRKRLRQRGYNQSAYIAEGVATKMELPFSDKLLLRNKATSSQTKKSRYHRYENMQEVFKLALPETVKGKHILLVDDVLTTGATLEACGNELLKHGAARLSIATAAFSE